MSDRPMLFSAAMSKSRGIAFKPEMVRAILAGEKTQTRRLASDFMHRPDGPLGAKWYMRRRCGLWDSYETMAELAAAHGLVAPGDTLWVREAWKVPSEYDAFPPRDVSEYAPVLYLADGAERMSDYETELRSVGAPQGGRYRHARFMPRWASRIERKVTGVHVERLGDISEADALAEGAVHWARSVQMRPSRGSESARYAFEHLWEHVHGEGAWERDRKRWTWVYEWDLDPVSVTP